MKGKLKKILEVVIPLALSALLIMWLFKKVNFQQVMHLLRSGVDYGWLIVVMVIVVMSHVIRGIRWGYQLRAAGVGNVPVMALCCSIFGAYAVNLIVPDAGEAWRIIYIAKRQKVPVSTVLGTDIGDRLSDAAVVLLLLVLAVIVGHPYIFAFMDKYSEGERIKDILYNGWFWGGFALICVLLAGIFYFFRHAGWMQKVIKSLSMIWHGFAVLFTMKGRWTYLILTLGIWGCYFLETYIGFLSFGPTRHLMTEHGLALGLLPALISFVFSSMSMIIPSNGGLGPWNLAVMFALSLFGMKDSDGAAFSILVWSTVTITLVLLGLFTIGYVIYSRAKMRKTNAILKTKMV